MHLDITFKNLRPRRELRARAEALYAKLERFLDPAAVGRLMVQVEHGRAELELVIAAHGDVHAVTQEEPELRTALDKLFHKMEVKLRRNKERRQERWRDADHVVDGFSTGDGVAATEG